MGKIPDTLFTSPDKESSPINSVFSISSKGNCPVAHNMPIAMGRSYLPPSFGSSAGARFIVILECGKSKPEFIIALRTLSLLSLTAISGNPTNEKAGNPPEICTSTDT
jgi:hypothetical protein